jgi:hypothetical protein
MGIGIKNREFVVINILFILVFLNKSSKLIINRPLDKKGDSFQICKNN